MNFTKFKFNCELYKQKSGTPIATAISLILSKIVMEDLKRSVFENLRFVVPFYFR